MENSTVERVHMFWCHECNREMNHVDGLQCIYCNSEFIEEMENPEMISEADIQGILQGILQGTGQRIVQGTGQNQPLHHILDQALGPFIQRLAQYNTPTIIVGATRSDTTPSLDTALESLFLHYQSNLPLFTTGPIFEFFQSNGQQGTGEFDTLLHQLFQNHSPQLMGLQKEQMDALPRKKMDQEGECCVCKIEYEMGQVVVELFCKHVFHQECILGWVGINATCPICRFSLLDYFEKHPVQGNVIDATVVDGSA
ncbi:MAG: hypothetical protein RL713_999, partial [Bacteroidota bacterium]